MKNINNYLKYYMIKSNLFKIIVQLNQIFYKVYKTLVFYVRIMFDGIYFRIIYEIL